MEIKLKIISGFVIFFAILAITSVSVHKAQADLSNAICSIDATILNASTGLVKITGTVTEQHPGLDPSFVSTTITDTLPSPDSGQSKSASNDSLTDSYQDIFPSGTYRAFIDGTSFSNPNGGSSSCTNSTTFTVPAQNVGTIQVISNLATGFVITGANNLSANIAANTTYTYSNEPIGSYTITPDTQNGYTFTVTPSATQTLNNGATITFTINYSSSGGGGPTVTLTANPTSITLGSSSTLNWSSTNATSCTASNGWSGGKSTSGSQSVSPGSTTTYTLTCTGPGGSANASATVTVTSGGGGGGGGSPVTADIKANGSNGPISIVSGNSATISWTSANATSCTVQQTGWTGTSNAGISSGALSSNSSFTLNCTGPGGFGSDSVQVNVTAPPVPVPSKPVISAPSCSAGNYTATISWTPTNSLYDIFLDDSGAGGKWWAHNYDGNSGSISAPSQFVVRLPGNPALTLQPDKTYYVQLQDSYGQDSPVTSWSVPSACPSGTVVVNIVPNTVVTNFTVNGPTPVTCTGCGSKTYPSMSLSNGSPYSISGIASIAGYGVPTLNPNSSQLLVNTGDTITWTISYPPPTPTISSIDNSSCGKLIINWSDVTNETGYQVWRSASGGAFNFGAGDGYTLIKTLAANVTTYTDVSVTTGNKYWYRVVAQGTGGNSVSAAVQSGIVLACAPNLSNSQKFIYQVCPGGINCAATTSLTVIHPGDKVIFRFTINNANTATDSATINGITDTMSSNFSTPTNAKVDKGSGFTCLNSCNALTGSPFTIPVTGTLAAGVTWTVQYDATANSTVTDLFTNTGTINCTATNNGSTNCSVTRQVKFINSSEQPPTFREVGP